MALLARTQARAKTTFNSSTAEQHGKGVQIVRRSNKKAVTEIKG
jgi:hypothetical protein